MTNKKRLAIFSEQAFSFFRYSVAVMRISSFRLLRVGFRKMCLSIPPLSPLIQRLSSLLLFRQSKRGLTPEPALLVTGVVDSINTSFGDSFIITLSNGIRYSLSNPQFSFDRSNDEEKAKVAELNVGGTVTVLGESTGETLGTAMVRNCILITDQE